MAAPDPEERKLIEHCKNYIVACGVLRGIQYENIASMQDAMKMHFTELSGRHSVLERPLSEVNGRLFFS